MKFKVVEFITNLSDGGAETLVKDYAIMLQDRMDVTVLTIRNFTHTAIYKMLKEHNVKIVSVYPKWNLGVKVFNKLFGRWYIPYKLTKILKEEDPDCIHVHLYLLKYVKRIADAIRGKKLLYTCHNVASHYFGPDYPEQTDAAEYLIKHNGLQMVALHDDMRRELDEMFGVSNTAVIRNGVDFSRFTDITEPKEEIRRDLGIPENAYVLGHVGRFTLQKNHEFLVEVFREAAAKNLDAFLLMVGNGELQEQIEQKLEAYGLRDRAMILSHRTDVPRLMKAMDVFIFPSSWEGFGIVMVEAQLCGLRCLPSEAVPDATHLSELVLPMQLSDGAEKWAEVALDRNLLSRFPDRLYEYDMKREIDRLEALYREK